MTNRELTALRLYNQYIAASTATTAYGAVKHLCAMQAQNYPGVLWSVGLRVPGAAQTDIEQAVADRTIVRSWPMRGTLHYVAAEDIKWMTTYLTPKVVSGAASRHRNLELDEAVFDKAKTVLIHELSGSKVLTRQQIFEAFERAGIRTAGQRGVHICWYWSQKGLLCCGPYIGKQPTFVLLDEWVTNSRELTREEAFAELALRYFTGHGPATMADFANWLKASLTDARAGLAAVEHKLVKETIDGETYWMGQPPSKLPTLQRAFLLPGFDEYLLGYKDRSAMLLPGHEQKIVLFANGMFRSAVVIDGVAIGVWNQIKQAKKTIIQLQPFIDLTNDDIDALQQPLAQYQHFVGSELKLTIRN